MNYRRVMRISSLIKVAAPLTGVVLVLAGCGAEQDAEPTRRRTVRDRRQRNPRTQNLGAGASRRDGHHLPKHLHQSGGGHRLPQGHDRRCAPAATRWSPPTRWPPRRPVRCSATAGPPPTRWSPRRRCSAWSSRSPPASAAAASCSTTTRRRVRCRPTTAERSRPPPRPRTICAGSPTPTAPNPSPTPAHPAAPSACPASCGSCRTSTPSTARPAGATCSTPPSRSPTTASTSARGWRPPSPTPRRN